MSRDEGWSVEYCQQALNAATALVVGAKAGERRQWIKVESLWKEQLRFAQARMTDKELLRAKGA